MSDAESDRLRALTLGNVAAGLGELGAMEALVWNLPRGEGEAKIAHQCAMQLHARAQDDFFPNGRTHVGVISLAVVLALAREAGDRMLECLAAGYRVMCAVSAAYALSAQQRGVRPTGVFGPLAGAAAAGVALRLEPAAVANAIGLAAAMTGGTNQAWLSGTDEWLIEVGAAARAGLEAARYSQAGARASDVALEGKAGWARAFFDDDGGERLQDLLDRGWTGIEGVAGKPYPVSGIAQVPTHLGCIAHGRLQGGFERAWLTLSEAEGAYPGTANRGPFSSRSDALMSVAFCVATGLHTGTVKLAQLENPSAAQHLVSRVNVDSDRSFKETDARLRVITGGQEMRLDGTGKDVLFLNWEQISTDTDQIARRSEADPIRVRAAAEALGRPRPVATELVKLLDQRA